MQDDFSTLGVRYTKTLGAVSFNISAFQLIGSTDTTLTSVSLSMPLGGGASSGAGIENRGGRTSGDLRLNKNAPPAGGLGYYARAGIDNIERYEAGAEYRTRFGDTSATLSRVDTRTAGRLSVRGGAALIDGNWVVAPAITDSIAIVTIGREPGIRVFQDRQPVGVTDKSGRIVLTRLRPFERNTISFDPRDVRLDAEFNRTEMVVVPGLRTGHRIDFGITQSRNVIAYIVDPNGEPISDRGRIADAETGETYPIGQDGRIYIADAKTDTRLKFVRNRMICEARIRLQPVRLAGPYEDAGSVVCAPTTKLR